MIDPQRPVNPIHGAEDRHGRDEGAYEADRLVRMGDLPRIRRSPCDTDTDTDSDAMQRGRKGIVE